MRIIVPLRDGFSAINCFYTPDRLRGATLAKSEADPPWHAFYVTPAK
jgi:hypothetical protein